MLSNSDVKTRKRLNVVGIDMVRNNCITSNTAKTPKQSLSETLPALEEENQKILDEHRLRELLEKNKDLKQKLKQTDLKQKHDKTTTEVTLGGLRKDEELKQKVKDKQSRLVEKLVLSDDSDSDSDSEVRINFH